MAGEEHVVGVGPPRRPQPTGVPGRDLDAADQDGVGPRVDRGVDAGLPPRHGARAGVRHRAAGRSVADASPCSRAQSLGRHVVERSTIAAARGSVPRASAFSSSVSVSTRSARISSISVASHRSPSLSGAIAGWSYRMIGDDSTTSASSPSPDRAPGTCRRCGTPATAAPRRPSAGRAARRRRRRRRRAAVCTATSERRSASSRVGVLDRRRRRVLDRHGDLHERAGAVGPLARRRAPRRRPARGGAPRDAATRCRRRSAVAPAPRRRAGDHELARASPPASGSRAHGRQVDLVLDRLVPRHPR